jgi:hypothetical protein
MCVLPTPLGPSSTTFSARATNARCDSSRICALGAPLAAVQSICSSVLTADSVATPTSAALTGYDTMHLITYLRLLDADADGADWREVAKIVLKIDPKREPERAKRMWESHLSRAKWMTKSGFRHLLRGGPPN